MTSQTGVIDSTDLLGIWKAETKRDVEEKVIPIDRNAQTVPPTFPEAVSTNVDAAMLLDSCDAGRLRWVCLGHLSAHNNTPQVALATHQAKHLDRFSLHCADRDGATKLPIL